MEHETTPGTFADSRLDRLDAALSEPAIARVTSMAKAYNDVLAEQDVTKQEADAIIRELDHEWGRLNNMPVHVTGRVRMYVGNGRPEDMYVEDEPFISKGFCSVSTRKDTEGHRIKTAYYLYYPASQETQRQTGLTYTGCYADIDDVTLDMRGASSERATAWLSVFEPELTENIDIRVLNANGNEANALYALKDLRFTLPKEELDFASVCINRYVSDIIQFDDRIPYGVNIDGILFIHANDDQFIPARLTGGKMLVMIESVIPVLHGDEYELAVRVSSLPSDRHLPGRSILLPLSSVTSLVSLREAYYAS